jgi:hypothetical protein
MVMGRARSAAAVAVIGAALLASAVTASSSSATVSATVTPKDDLADGQPVTIAAKGFAPNISVGAAECSAAAVQSKGTEDCDLTTSKTGSADANGHASLSLRVKRTIVTPNGTVDCATATKPCIVAIANLSDYTDSFGVRINFDPNAPPVGPPAVTVAPNADLPDNQPVYVTASGFVQGEIVTVMECPAEHIDCPYSGPGFTSVQADADGNIATVLTVRRLIAAASEVYDCAEKPGDCVIVARTAGLAPGVAPLAFDSSIPLPPRPTLTVTPPDGLADRQTVTVTGEGFEPKANLTIGECVPNEDDIYPLCSEGTFQAVTTDDNGDFSLPIVVRRIISSYPGVLDPVSIDCATNPVPCAINANNYQEPTDQATAQLGFDSSLPLPPPPTAAVTPDDGLADRQIVTVTGSGFSPHAAVIVAECAGGTPGFSGCSQYSVRVVQANAHGHVSATLRVRRTFDAYTGGNGPTSVDCATATDPCQILVVNNTESTEVTRVPIGFDPDAPAFPGPSATVTPSTDLVDGQTVAVDGENLDPGNGAYVVQCAAGGTDALRCDTSQIGSAAVDDTGHATMSYAVKRTITAQTILVGPGIPKVPATGPDTVGDDTVDCASGAGACTLTLLFSGGSDSAVSVPLTFDSSVTTEPTSTSTTDPTTTVGDPTTSDAPTSTDQSSDELARTGASHTLDLMTVAGVLVLVGLALTLTAARRRRTSR